MDTSLQKKEPALNANISNFLILLVVIQTNPELTVKHATVHINVQFVILDTIWELILIEACSILSLGSIQVSARNAQITTANSAMKVVSARFVTMVTTTEVI